VRELAEPILAAVGSEPGVDDDDRTRELRATLVRVLGTVGGSHTVIASAAEALDHDDASLAAAALTVMSHNGGEDEYDTVHDRWQSADDPQGEIRNLRALANFPSVELVDQLLTEISHGSVRTQDAPYVLARAMHNRFVDRYVWAYVRDNWADLDGRFPSNSIPRMLSGITALDEPDLVAEVADFLANHPIPQAGKQVEQHLERQAINARLRGREHERFSRSLRS
jgi:aminopeptidase N